MPVAPLANKFGKARGENQRLAFAAVVGLAKVDRVLVDTVEQRLGDRRQSRFRVAHGSGVIAVDIAEVALTLDQPIAHGEALRQPNQRLVHRLIAVRMVLADHVANDTGAFLEARSRIEPQLPHGVHEPALDRL